MRGPQTYINGSPDRGEQARTSLQGSRTLFVFTLSTRAFDSPWLSAASMPARWSRIERASCTNAGSPQCQAHVGFSSARPRATRSPRRLELHLLAELFLSLTGRGLMPLTETAQSCSPKLLTLSAVSYTHLRAHETVLDLVCRLLLEKK